MTEPRPEDPKSPKPGVWRQIYRSIFRHRFDDTPRNRLLQITSNVFLHLHPPSLPRHGVRLKFTWGAGGLYPRALCGRTWL